MFEGVYSLMQLAKTSVALSRYMDGSLPYVSVLTDPTFGGVTASFATAADVIIAEPGAGSGSRGRGSSSRRRARGCPRASRRPSSSGITGWSIGSCTGSRSKATSRDCWGFSRDPGVRAPDQRPRRAHSRAAPARGPERGPAGGDLAPRKHARLRQAADLREPLCLPARAGRAPPRPSELPRLPRRALGGLLRALRRPVLRRRSGCARRLRQARARRPQRGPPRPRQGRGHEGQG